jgi:indolepyruvate ferredoxin oxidoreductase alpha subunit
MPDTARSEVLTALDALAFGLLDGGVRLVTGYPGFHAHDLVDRCGGSLSVNERTAYAVAWGAALAGHRAAVTFKNVGLNDAADPFLNSMYLRTSAGLVVVVLDDIEVTGSQIRQDSRHYFDVAPGLWLEPTTAAHAYRCARAAPRLSEEFGVPVVLRVTNALIKSTGSVVRRVSAPTRPMFVRNPEFAVAHPMNVASQVAAANSRQQAVGRFVERQFRPRGKGRRRRRPVTVQVGASGLSREGIIRESQCVLWTLPLPERGLRRYLRSTTTVTVSEVGTPMVGEKIKSIKCRSKVRCRDESAAANHSANYRSSAEFESLFSVLRSFPDQIVCGDLGSFTMDSPRTIDACLCYGASVGVAMGCSLAKHPGSVFCVTGDSAFLHSGQQAFQESIHRGARFIVILIDNGNAASTGGQCIPSQIVLPPRCPIRKIDHPGASPETYRKAIEQLAAQDGMAVLHVRTRRA